MAVECTPSLVVVHTWPADAGNMLDLSEKAEAGMQGPSCVEEHIQGRIHQRDQQGACYCRVGVEAHHSDMVIQQAFRCSCYPTPPVSSCYLRSLRRQRSDSLTSFSDVLPL